MPSFTSSSGYKPLIGCTTYRKVADQNPPIELYGLMPSYIKAVEAAGGLPVLIPLGLSEENLQAVLARLDGVLLPGGGDIDPATYRGNGNERVYDIDSDRDRVEFAVARTAVAQQKPLLAICRGHQVLNVALGGSLWEDIQQLMPGAMKHDHFRIRPRNYLAHTVSLAPDSHVAQLLGTTETAVNSLHHQGIRELASELRATAVATDGLIESVEVPGHPFAVGVQWHPENLIEDDPNMLSLFKGLVSVAQNGRH